MKHFVTLLAIATLLNLSVAGYSVAGPVKKQPLQVQELVALQEKQATDHQDIEGIEAGIKDGYGILIILLIVGVGYLIYDQINEDDDNESNIPADTSSSPSSTGTQ